MGLLDVLSGMSNAEPGQRAPGSSEGGMSPITKAIIGGGAAGGGIGGGLNDLLKQFQQNGQGDVANSWIGKGPNKSISPNDLATALGADRVNAVASFSGMSRSDLLSQLSQQLPNVVDQLTPDGRLPTE
jgi:uncharacterized protein YidB (DUF937 family)